MAEAENEIRCTRCRAEFTREELKGVNACPACGSQGVPMGMADDVTIEINWHELRILTIWASNYATRTEGITRDSKEALAAILHALALQHPDKAPLTLAGDIGELRRAAESGELTGNPTTVETNVRDMLDEDGAVQ